MDAPHPRLIGPSLLCVVLGLSAGPTPVRAADDAAPAKEATAPARDSAKVDSVKAVSAGLTWLAGEWEKGGSDKESDAMGRGNIACAALAGLAFLQAGADPDNAGQGPSGKALHECLQFVTGHCDDHGLISVRGGTSPMYGHGIATYFLAEASARSHDRDRQANLRTKLNKAVELIKTSQNKDGAWRYTPHPFDGDISVTACQLLALEAAKKAGADVDADVITRGVAYVRSCQNKDGGFSYMAGQGVSNFTRTAAAAAVLSHAGPGAGAGAETDKALAAARKYLHESLATFDKRAGTVGDGKKAPDAGWFFYGSYYLAHAAFAAPGAGAGPGVGPDREAESLEKAYPIVRHGTLARQTQSGAWEGEISKHYATAVALIVLQMPEGGLGLSKTEATKPAQERRGAEER